MKTLFASILLLLVLRPDFGEASKPPPPQRSPPRSPNPPRPPSPPANLRLKNGVRLVGGAGPRGRLEVSSKNAWFSPPGGKTGWSAVCDSADFTDDTAKNMCVMLGYNFGRKYFAPELAYVNVTNATRTEPPYYVGKIYCGPQIPLRHSHRLLRSGGGGDIITSSGGDVITSSGGDVTADRTVERSLYSVERYFIASTRTAPFTCYFYSGGPCGPTGPLAGVECSHLPMAPAPPPPPRPPMPPPSLAASIRMVGGLGVNMSPRGSVVEANLCDASPDLCPLFARFELQVRDPSQPSQLVWAPLCAPEEPWLADAVGSTACGQVYDWPQANDGGVEIVLTRNADMPFLIPQAGAVVNDGDFDPTTVPGWVVVTAPPETKVPSVQEFEYTVTSEPCPSGGLLAASCQAWGEYRRRQ